MGVAGGHAAGKIVLTYGLIPMFLHAFAHNSVSRRVLVLLQTQVLEFALPEDIERLRNSKKRDLGVSEKLQLMDGAICGVSSIELQWRCVLLCVRLTAL